MPSSASMSATGTRAGMGKRGFQPHPSLSSATALRDLMRRHSWYVPAAAEEISRTKSAVYQALKSYGVRIPKKYAQEIGDRQRRNAATSRWGKR